MVNLRLLLVEDESGIAVVLYTSLIKAGFIVEVAKTGHSALRKASSKSYDIILLDLGLPDMSGLTVCRQLRRDGLTVPIIALTGERMIKSKVSLLDAGANDYITKPFSFDELKARIQACLRSSNPTAEHRSLVIGELKLNPDSRTAQRADYIVPLTRKEFSILEYLMQHAGSVVTRASLAQYVWNGQSDNWTNTIDVHIKHLRDKVDRPFSQQLITTVHGIGYKLQVPNLLANT